MRIFVTGASGFVGRFLCQALEKEGHEVVGIDSKSCDLLKAESLYAFSSPAFDQIYHLAAWTQAGDFCLRHPGEQWVRNQLMHTHVLKWWSEQQPQAKLIALGTSCSYDPSLPHQEENYLLGLPHDSLFAYAMSKRMLLTGLEALHRQYGLEYLYAVPSTLYGPGYHTDGRQMHFIFDLMRKIITGKLFGDPVTLWGNGWQKRELIHVEDFINALLPLSSLARNCVVNIASGDDHSIRHFAQLICQEVGYPFEKIFFDESRYVGAKEKKLLIDRLKSLLPTFSCRPLEAGIKETLVWMQETLFSLSTQS